MNTGKGAGAWYGLKQKHTRFPPPPLRINAGKGAGGWYVLEQKHTRFPPPPLRINTGKGAGARYVLFIQEENVFLDLIRKREGGCDFISARK